MYKKIFLLGKVYEDVFMSEWRDVGARVYKRGGDRGGKYGELLVIIEFGEWLYESILFYFFCFWVCLKI